MQIALIGFSKSGKTTVFNALTGSAADVSAFSMGAGKTHRATVEVPDSRLDLLHELYQSKKLVHATVDYIDPVGIRRDKAGSGEGLGDEMLNTIATADALAAVIRAFEDDSGVMCDPEGDFEAIVLELILSDLAKVDARLERIEKQVARIGGAERTALLNEQAVMLRLKEALEANSPARALDLSHDEERILRSFQFLTMKPLIVVLNVAEDTDESERQALIEALEKKTVPGLCYFLSLCGTTEMEIAQLAQEERTMFLKEYGIEEQGSARMICLSYEALGLISFFTAGPKETHAWNLKKALPAVEAAGEIHSDMQRGFIRAQVISWRDLLEAGSVAEAKKHGNVRIEGKDYIVQDGDVLEIMFSV